MFDQYYLYEKNPFLREEIKRVQKRFETVLFMSVYETHFDNFYFLRTLQIISYDLLIPFHLQTCLAVLKILR